MNIIVNNVLTKAADILNITAAIDLENVTPSDVFSAELTLLLRCFNLTMEEIARDYFPLLLKQNLTPVNGVIVNTAFTKPPVEIYSVKKGGEAVEYTLYPDGMHLSANAEHEIIYGYLAGDKTIEEVVEVHPKVTEGILVLGTLMNYCVASGKYEDSLIYERRFKETLREKLRKAGELKLPERRWI